MREASTTEAGPTNVAGGAGEHAIAVRTAAYAELYRERNKQLIAYASSLTGNAQVAEDLVAEAHFRVWRRLRAGHEVRNVPAYLSTTVRNLAAGINRGRPENASDSGGLPAEKATVAAQPQHSTRQTATRQTTAQQTALRASHVELLARLLKELPDRWAGALWYAEVEDLPMESVGARIGAGASTAAVVLTRARERLRQAFLQSQPGTPAAEACAEYWKLMPSLVRGSASARQARRLNDHTDGCADCRERLLTLTEINGRLPLILGPALLAGVLGGGGTWLMPSISGAARTGSKMARHARVKTGVLSHARAHVFTRSIVPAKGALVGSVGVVGIAAAAAAFALGSVAPHHDTAAATTATTTTPSGGATGSAGSTAGSASSTVTAAAIAATPTTPAGSAGSESSATPDATRSPLAQGLQPALGSAGQAANAAAAANGQGTQSLSPSLSPATPAAPATGETTASASDPGTTSGPTSSPTQTSSSPSASASSSASPSTPATDSSSPSASPSTSGTSAGPTASASDTPTDSPSAASSGSAASTDSAAAAASDSAAAAASDSAAPSDSAAASSSADTATAAAAADQPTG